MLSIKSPCYALIDMGAQDGVVGMWLWQRWVICLALVFRLRLVLQELPEICDVGCIGGTAKALAICDILTAILGINGTYWVLPESFAGLS